MHRIHTAFVAATVSTVVCASAALAADMPTKAPMFTKAPAPAADPWTGWYIGASVGARFTKDTWTTTQLAAGIIAVDPRDNPHDFSSSSARVGLYGGYNWRLQQMWVVGLETDVAWANNKGTNSGSVPGVAVPTSDSTQVQNTWDGGLRARAGYLITPTTLLYGTGGVALMQSKAAITCAGTILTSWCSGTNQSTGRTDTGTKTLVGWTLGGGLEMMITPNWFLRGEYRYTRFDGYSATLLSTGGIFNSNLDQIDADIKNRSTQTALIGLAYRFGL